MNENEEREKSYDEQIAPLVTQIETLCDQYGIGRIMTFELTGHEVPEEGPLRISSLQSHDWSSREFQDMCHMVYRTYQGLPAIPTSPLLLTITKEPKEAN